MFVSAVFSDFFWKNEQKIFNGWPKIYFTFYVIIMSVSDYLLLWLFCMAAAQKRRSDGPPTLVNDEVVAHGEAALLLHKRLTIARDRRVTSFISGMIALFLSAPMFPDSVVLSTLPLSTVELFISLLLEALPGVRRCRRLFRSSRGGATPTDFRAMGAQRGPMLTLIKDADGNVFGGYAGLEWGNFPSFLFTIINPHADPPALFPAKVHSYPMYSASSYGPMFGYDLWVDREFNRLSSWSYIGRSYVNTSLHSGRTVLTGASQFTPIEVEVWGIE